MASDTIDPYVPPFCLTQAELDETARICTELLCHGADWIDRRKEAVTVLTERRLRRRMSVDLSLSSRLPKHGGDYLAPLFFLEKGRAQSTNFDFLDEKGTRLTLPTRYDNALVSMAVLHAAAEAVLGDEALSPGLWNDLGLVAQRDPPEAEQILTDMGLVDGTKARDDEVAKLYENADFRWLAEALASSSVLLVPLSGNDGDRKIIKLAFDQEIDDLSRGSRRGVIRAGWSGYAFVVDTPYVGARTYHFEIHVPPGVELTRARLFVASRDRVGRATVHGPRRDMHLYVPEGEDQRTGAVALDFRLGRAGFMTGAVVASGVVLVALVLFLLFAENIAQGGSSSAPSLLLALPGAIATYVLRVEEQSITSRLLVWARAFLLISGLSAFAAALRIGVAQPTPENPVSASALQWTWGGLAVVALIAFIGLLITRLAPPVPRGNE